MISFDPKIYLLKIKLNEKIDENDLDELVDSFMLQYFIS